MGSNYLGGSSSSSSRKGKKSSEKPKQPQRGLGVAQLEKIRLHDQLGYSPNLHPSYQEDIRAYGFNSTVMPGVISTYDQYDHRTNIRYSDFQPPTTPSWIPNANIEAQQSNMLTRHRMDAEDSMHKKTENHMSHLMRSSSQNFDSGDTREELDLELRLSL